MNDKNLSDHNSKRADELMIKNAQKGLFILQYFTCKSCGDIPDDGKKIDALSKETENTFNKQTFNKQTFNKQTIINIIFSNPEEFVYLYL